MFGNFRNDPFFSDAFPDMNGFDRSFMDPFAQFSRPNRQAIGGNNARGNTNNQQQQQQVSTRNLMSNPFALMNQMMGNMNNMFGNMDHMMNDSNAQVYSSSSVMTYSNTGNGAPKVYQASSQTTQLPGGIRETRRAVRDSERGVEKMAIGHHIGNKAHIIERKKNREGQLEEMVNLENLDDNEIPDFDREFEERIRGGFSNNRHMQIDNRHSNRHNRPNQPLAIDDGHKKYEQSQSQPLANKTHLAKQPPNNNASPKLPHVSNTKPQQAYPRPNTHVSRSNLNVPTPQTHHHRFLRPTKPNPTTKKVPFKF